MMRFSQRRTRSSRALLIAVLLAAVVILADSLSGGMFRALLRGTATLAATPVRMVSHTELGAWVSSRSELAGELARLKEENAVLTAERFRRDVLENENDELRELTHLAADEPGRAVRVVSSFRSSPFGTLILGSGTREGIAAGDLALAPGGFVIGTVTDVSPGSATLQTLFSRGERLDVVFGDEAAELEGLGGSVARAEVSRDTGITEGAVALAPAFGGRPVGVVGSLERNDADAFARLLVRTPANLDVIPFLYIVRP